MLLEALTGNLTFVSSKPPDLTSCTRQQLREYFENCYDLNESLFTSLKEESVFYKCPDRLRLPLIFYFCHTAVVYVNKLLLAGLIKERVDYDFEVMFETGVDEMSWDDTENFRMGGSYQWPSLDKVVSYRRRVKDIILNVIENTPLELPIDMESPWWALLMGMEHERIHVETSSVLIRQLPVDMVTKPDGWVYGPMKFGSHVKTNPMVKIPETTVTYGKPVDFPSYGWDNEYGQVTAEVPAFEASKYMVTNGQFLEFVLAGGYNNRSMWSEEGWSWKSFRHANHPVFWVCDNGCKSGCGGDLSNYSHCHLPKQSDNYITDGTEKPKYMYRAMFDVIALPMDWPVDVNYHEARAYCVWKGSDYRLITEAEHNVIRGDQPLSKQTECDVIYNKETLSNHNFKYGSSTPVNMHKASPMGLHDVYGNVWEWAEDHFNGLEGYHSHYLYDDFSSPCFDGRHNLILGGSWASTGDEASRFARFAFRRHFIQHCGFRLARSLNNSRQKIKIPARLIETDIFVLGVGIQDIPVTLNPNQYEVQRVPTTNNQYQFDRTEHLAGIMDLEFGYRDSLPNVVSELCVNYTKIYKCDTQSAVWFGSGAGKGPFLLSQSFDDILAVDFCGRFVDCAMQLQKGKKLQYTKPDGSQATVDIPQNTNNVTFKQFTWIPNEVGKHDLVVVTFLERLLNPKAWLARLWDITEKSGLIVIASVDGTWKRDNLSPHLGESLKCICVQEVPVEGPEHTTATVTVWRHKN